MSISKAHLHDFRNAEHYQFMISSYGIFSKHNLNADVFGGSYTEFALRIRDEGLAMTAEKNSEKVREKNEADRYRDKLHSRLYSYVKSVTYDDRDPNVASAQTVMKVIRDTGSPANLAENAASAVFTVLINRLNAVRSDMEAIGADQICDALNKANNDFIKLEKECRDLVSAQQMSDVPSTSVARKKTNEAYRIVVNAINGYAGIPAYKEKFRNLIVDMNTLITKYNLLVAGRSDDDKDKDIPELVGDGPNEGEQ